MSDLAFLSAEAHKAAIAQGWLTPAERYEFSHLPMLRINGVPVFDEIRMRDDQVDDACERLRHITGRVHAKGVGELVEGYMVAYGRFGLRVKDICEAVSASKPIVLKYLREMIDAGTVVVMEEATRGAGSKRKRYYWTQSIEDLRDDDLDGLDGLEVLSDGRGEAGSGVIHHGCAVYGLVCPCRACGTALLDAFDGAERSAALRRGETGLSAGLELRRVRREALVREDGRLLAAGLAALNG